MANIIHTYKGYKITKLPDGDYKIDGIKKLAFTYTVAKSMIDDDLEKLKNGKTSLRR